MGEVANPYNLIENGSFEAGAYGATQMNAQYGASYGRSGMGIKFHGTPTTMQVTAIEVKLNNATEADTYLLSAWANANSVPDITGREFVFTVRIKIEYQGGGSESWVYRPLEFNTYVQGWQYSCIAFNLNDYTSATRTPIKLTIYPTYDKNCNTVYFDNLQLVKDDVPAYVYDADGKVTTVTTNAQQKSTMEYSNSDLTKSIDAKGYSYTYTYDNNHNMTSATSQNKVKTSYTYNNKGIATDVVVEDEDETLKTSTKAEYYQDGNYIKSITDANGDKDFYDYDLTTGTLKSYTKDGKTVDYSYNAANDRLETVATETDNGTVFNHYTYEDNMLAAIEHNGFEYGFSYDDFGNTLTTSICSRTLMTQAYRAANGKLSRSTYGNGVYFENTYDELSRVIGSSYNGTSTFKWKYNNLGQAVEHEDIPNNTRINSTYDTTGRLIRSEMKDRTTGALLQSSEYCFDLNNNVTKSVNVIGDTTLTNTLEYGKDNLLTKTTLPTGADVTNTFDGLNRLTERKLNISQTLNKSTTYTYAAPKVAVNESNTTTQLASETIDGVEYSYTYDALGNITEIREDDVLKYAYKYDELYSSRWSMTRTPARRHITRTTTVETF